MRAIVALSISWVGLCVLPTNRLEAQTRHQLQSLRGVVVVANGSGDTVSTTNAFVKAIDWTPLRVAVATQYWTRQQGALVDHADIANHHRHGRRIAQAVLYYRSVNPALKIVLAAHSSGSAVVLAAAKYLPANSVDHIVLLAPSVSCTYDLRPALRASRYGIDSYYSEFDVTLGVAADMLGTADGIRNKPTAGVVGFSAYWTRLTEPKQLWKLRQHKWDESYYRLGARGTHYGWTNSRFIFYRILPSLFPTPRHVEVVKPESDSTRPKAGR